MNRRNFLQHTAAGLLPVFLGGYGARAYGQQSPMLEALAKLADLNDRVLVLVQLSGGNDGLNMVIPLDQMSQYNTLRSNIALPEAKVLKLNNNLTTGLHTSMTGLQSLYNEGKLSIVHSVSYPAPNFSHFRANDIWFTGANSNQTLTTGWAGRYLDQEYPGYPDKYPTTDMPDPLAVQISYIPSTSLLGPAQSMAIAIQNPDTFAQLVGDRVAIDTTVNTSTPAGKQIAFIRQQQISSVQYAGQLKTAAGKGKNLATYPTGNTLADQLKIVARLIHGGLRTKVYYVSIGGFDTHANQVNVTDTTIGQHANLMKQVSDGIKSFMDDLKLMGIDDRVAGMTFSEFGRRAISNASYGTDHGAAAPLFAFGNAVKRQVIGKNPDLKDLDNNNIKIQTDYRQVYAAFLSDFLGEKSTVVDGVLGKAFDKSLIFQQLILANEPQPMALRLFPNPAVDDVMLEADAFSAGVSAVNVADATGRRLSVPVSVLSPTGLGISVRELPMGTYFVSVETLDKQRLTARMLVAR